MPGLFRLMCYKEVYIGFGKHNYNEVTVMVTKDFTSIKWMAWASFYKIQVSIQLHNHIVSACLVVIV